jgi:ABC-2 type transport system ATP-binding protein
MMESAPLVDHRDPYRSAPEEPASTQNTQEQVALRCEQLTFSYDGLRNNVDRLSFSIPRGHLFALLGPNGAGKTSTLRLLAGLLEPTAGSAMLGDVDLGRGGAKARGLVGYLPDDFALYDNQTALENLQFFARLQGLTAKQTRARIEQLLAEFDLSAHAKRRVGDFSRGMRQRLGLAKTLLHRPELILLDEPASALDPDARAKLKKTLARLKNRNQTVIVSSHILPDLAGVADSAGILECGKLVYAGPLDERVTTLDAVEYEIRVLVPEHAEAVFGGFGPRLLDVCCSASEEGHYDVVLQGGPEALADLSDALSRAGARVFQLNSKESAIEAIYRKTAVKQLA